MFDLQLFDGTDTTVSGFGFLSAEDKTKLDALSTPLIAVSSDGGTAYFYQSADTSTTAAYSIQLSTGILPCISITGGTGTTTATCDGVTLTGTTRIDLTHYGTWTVTNGANSQSVTVDTVKVYNVTF